MDDEKRRLRDEVAELSEAVRSLREELAASHGHRGCCGHGCGHWHWGGYWQWHPVGGAAGGGITWTATNETATAGVSNVTIPGATTINAAAGGNTTYVLPTNNTCAAPILQ